MNKNRKRSTDQMVVVNTRWMIRRDIPDVLAIEQASFEYPWSEDDLLCCLRQENCVGRVATLNKEVVGFMVYIYRSHDDEIGLLNLAVDPQFRRLRVGAQMIGVLKDRLSHRKADGISLEVRETNLAAQLFFNSMGFRAISVIRDRYDDTDEDAYVMMYRLQLPTTLKGENRISEHLKD